MNDSSRFARFMAIVVALTCLAIGGLVAYASPVHAKANVDDPPGCNKDPCVIQHDGGGFVEKYEHLAWRLKQTGWKLSIDGECYSACVILADKARPNVCLTHKARFFIHQTKGEEKRPNGEYEPVRRPYEGYSEDINEWIEFNGGQPITGWLYMEFLEARKFWPACGASFFNARTTDE
jgi:hypothetical protein